MSTARTVAGQTLQLWWRDRRLPIVLLLLSSLGVLSTLLSVQRVIEAERDRVAAEAVERATFANQGARNPHSVAHFSRFAFRPSSPAAALDPGISPYAGVAIWLEAHWQDPANLRAAEDRVELGRFADLSLAWLMQILAPLLVVALAFDALAGERERGTLPLAQGAGVGLGALLRGKALALGSIFGGILVGLVCLQAAMALARADGQQSDTLLRIGAWTLGYAFYLFAWILLALAVSLRCARSRSALLVLLAAWTLATLIMPRLAITWAERIAPAPTPEAFAAAVARDLRDGLNGHDPADTRREAFKQKVLAEYGVQRVEDLPVSFAGLALQESERYGHIVFDRHFGALAATYRAQEHWRRLGALFGPLSALQQVSMGAATTDIAHHVQFMDQAERQRRKIIRMLDEDMIRHGAGQDFEYQADPSLWSKIPEFKYTPPRYLDVFDRYRWDGAILLGWALLALLAAWRMTVWMERAR